MLSPAPLNLSTLVGGARILCSPIGLGFGIVSIFFCCAAVAGAAPLVVRNITPVAHLYGIPAALGSQIGTGATGGFEYSFNLEQASSFTSASRGNSAVFLDGETTVATWAVRGGTSISRNSTRAPIQANWEWGVAVPFVLHSGGIFDSAIDRFHELFDLPDGGRPAARPDRIDYLVQIDGEVFANFQEPERDLGDVRAWLGYQWFANPKRSLAVRAQLKLPTGSVSNLSGSGAADLAVWLEYGEFNWLSRFRVGINLMAGAVYLGRGDLAPRRQQDLAGFAQLGLVYQFSPTVQLLGQIAGQTEILQTSIDQAQGAALQGTIGGRVALRDRLWLDLALVEDLTSDSSADVVFNLRLSAHL